MNIVRCPRCLDDVTVPLRASPKALVRCPLCLEEYLLREALGGLPPELEVIDGSMPEDEPALVGAGMAHAAAGRAEYGGGGDDYRLSGSGFDGALDASAPGAAVAAPRPVVKGARPKKKEKSAFVELVKIVLGGLVGLTLGYFALLWGFGMDVLDLGPKMARYAPWIVPTKFHGKQADNSTADASGAMDTSGDSTPKGANGKQKKSKGQQPMESVGGGVAPSSATDPAMPSDPLTSGEVVNIGGLGGVALEPELKPIPLPEPDLGPLLPEVNPKPEKPESKPAPATDPVETEPKPEPKPEPAPEAKPEPTADDLTKAVLAAADGYTKVNESANQSKEERRQLFTELYHSASEVGRIVSQLDATSIDLTPQLDTLTMFLGGIAVQPGKVSALKALTDIHLPQRKHDEGVLLAGVVQEFSQAGTLFACKFQAGKAMTEATIVSRMNPEDAYKIGDELLVVGRIVENPAKNLPGYEGESERVVLLGFGLPVPKAEAAPNP